MKKQQKNNKKVKAALIVAAMVAAVISLVAAVNAGANSSFSERYSRPLAVASASKAAVKSAPLAIGLPRGSVDGEVQISAQNDKWCKITYASGGKVKNGYIKLSGLTNQPYTDAAVSVSVLELSAPADMVAAGGEAEIEVKAIPSNANEALKWESSAPEIATVENGKITAVSPGEAIISASGTRVTSSVKITVSAPESTLAFSQARLEVQNGATANLAGALSGADGKISWSSSNSEVATVSDGKVSTKGAGLAIITAEQNGQRAQCTVSVTPISTHAKRALSMTNAYGDIYNYHPSTEYFADGWNGYKFWCAFTPYKSNDDQWENPHILASNDLKNWEEPSGFSNPLEPKPENYEHGKVYNSDTELVYNKDTGLLECWWRFYDRPNNRVVLRRKTTSDGVHWSAKEDMLVGEMYVYDFLSPALIYEDGLYKMWAINQNTGYSIDYRESADGKSWSEIRKITVNYEDKELAHWHLDVIRSAKGYEMSISAYYPATNDRVHMSLYYSYSPDNVNYTTACLLFTPPKGTGAWDNMGLYRSSLLYAGGKYYLFYSGLNTAIGPSGMGLVGGDTPFTMKDING